MFVPSQEPVAHAPARVVAALCVLAATLVWLPGTAAAATVGVSKSVNPTTISPEGAVTYQINIACSAVGEPEGCTNFTISDTFPSEFDASVVPGTFAHAAGAGDTTPSGGTTFASLVALEYSYTFDSGTGDFSLTFAALNPATTPLNIEIGMTLPAGTTVADGTVVPNEACVNADNNSIGEQCDGVDVTVDIPFDLDLAPTKSWDPASVIAQSGAATDVTLGITNQSSNSVDPQELLIADQTNGDPDGPPPDPWNLFDFSGLGSVAFTGNADQVQVVYCTAPYATQCTPNPGKWTGPSVVAGAQQTGPALVVDGGVVPADVTGVQFVYSNSGGAELDFGAGGSADYEWTLRDNERDGGELIEPTDTIDVDNTATSSALVDGPEAPCKSDPADPPCYEAGGNANASNEILPNLPEVTTEKKWFADPEKDYLDTDADPPADSDYPVSATVTATNGSPFPVEQVTIIEPTGAPPADDPFALMTVNEVALVFPAGAATADLTIDCDPDPDVVLSGLTPGAGPFVRPTDFNCDVAGVAVTYFGTGGGATIEIGSVSGLNLHGTLDDTAVPGTYQNCATSEVENSGAGTGTSADCDTLVVVPPGGPSGPGTKSVSQNELPENTPLDYRVRFTNNSPGFLDDIQIWDPATQTPAVGDDPFDIVRITNISSNCQGLSNTIELAQAGPTWIPYSGATAGQLESAIGWRVTLNETMPTGYHCTVNVEVFRRDGVADGLSFRNCFLVTTAGVPVVGGDAGLSTRCGSSVVTSPPSSAANLSKNVVPSTIPKPTPGLPPQTGEVKIRISNSGNTHLKFLQVVDRDDDGASSDFFDNFDFVGFNGVSFPPGANRVQVDVCTTGCASDTWVNGTVTGSSTPPLPGGVAPADVQGVRVTFTSSSGANSGFNLTPGENFPNADPCRQASICFDVTPRETSRSGGVPVDGTYVNTIQASGESYVGEFQIPPTEAPAEVVNGRPGIDVNKAVAGPALIAPGQTALFELRVENTGTAALDDLIVSDPIPAGLKFNDAGAGGQPYQIVEFDVPSGTSPPGPVDFTAATDANGRVTLLTWEFPGRFEVGSVLRILIGMNLEGGQTAGQPIENTMGAGSTSTDDFDCTDVPPDSEETGPPWPAGKTCTEPAEITAAAGTAFGARKWVAGNPGLGFWDSGKSAFVAIDDPDCPTLVDGGNTYTRFPCVALVNPGQNYKYLTKVTNDGTYEGLEVRVLDMLPRLNDTGVLDPASRGTDWSERPRLASEPQVQASGGTITVTNSFTTDTGAAVCKTELNKPPVACPSGKWTSPFDSDATGFQTFVAFDGGDPFPPAGTVTVRWEMSTPVDLDLTAAGYPPIAWNSFAHNEEYSEPGFGTEWLLPSEPLEVGVGMLFGGLQVDKRVVVPEGATQTEDSFELAYECTVTPDGATSATIVAQGTATFSESTPFTLLDQPSASTCKLWETDSGGATSDHPQSSPIEVAITPGSSAGEVTIREEITNTYPTPPTPATTVPPDPNAGGGGAEQGGGAGAGGSERDGSLAVTGGSDLLGLLGLLVLAVGLGLTVFDVGRGSRRRSDPLSVAAE